MAREDKAAGKEYSSYISALALLLIVICIPLLTLIRMLAGHIPVSQYMDNVLGRYKLISFNTGFSEVLSGGDYMESESVLLGKDGWLFYKVSNDGTPLYDYMGLNSFTEEELSDVYDGLLRQYEYFDAAGVRYAVLTVPNKEQVYSEYMPDTVEKLSEESRLDQLSQYLTGQTADTTVSGKALPYPYTDISGVYETAHTDMPLYYKTDTHWTDEGAYLALNEVMLRMYGRGLGLVTFTETDGFKGDLARISATLDRYTDVSYPLDADSVDVGDKRDETLLIIGDSFGDSLTHVAKYYYNEVYFVDIMKYINEDTDVLAAYEPDAVILECVERYLPRLKDLP